MASPQFAITPTVKTPVLRTPLSDDDIWKRLQHAGFDEESIKRRDKASLIAYISKLEAEIYDYQYQMGLLIMERKEWVSKLEKSEAALESAELMWKRNQAAHSSMLVEAKKREDHLEKAIGIERECVANIEKSLHELRAEYAETKVSADTKLAEARSLMDEALKKFIEADTKIRTAESLETEASRYHRAAERKLREVEAREDDLRRRLESFKTECDSKEEEFFHERQSLSERQKTLQQSQERVLDGQALLNQRESYIFDRMQELNRQEKELEASKSNLEKEFQALVEEKSNVEMKASSLPLRVEDVTLRECEVKKREEELLVLQEKLANKEFDRIQQLLANYEASLRNKKFEFEAELEMKRKLVEGEIGAKRRDWELREVDLCQREELILEKEHELELQSRAVGDKERDLMEKLSLLEEKQDSIRAVKREIESKEALIQKEKEEIDSAKLELQKSLDLLENEKTQMHRTEEKVEAMKNETSELLDLELKLKEEIETIRAQKQELEVEADEMKELKLKFEIEWQSIEEKRKEVQKEAECIAEEREILVKLLKDERNRLILEKDAMRDQYKRDNESLSRDREAFMIKMEHERSEWFSKIHQERSDFLLDIEVQRRDLEDRLYKRREEIESHLVERERAFEEEKRKELLHIAALRETLAKETEQVNLEMRRLDSQRREINLDRERRDKEWTELNGSIEQLKVQRQKLEEQRELLHADKEEILLQIEHLKQLEDLKLIPDRIPLIDIQPSDLQSSKQRVSTRDVSARRSLKQESELNSGLINDNNGRVDGLSDKGTVSISPLSTPLSWFKRCASNLLEQSISNKRMRPSEGTITASTISTQLNASADEHALMSLNQVPVQAKETTVYIDKVVTIREVTCADGGKVNGDNQIHEEAMPEGNGMKLAEDDVIEEENGENK